MPPIPLKKIKVSEKELKQNNANLRKQFEKGFKDALTKFLQPLIDMDFLNLPNDDPSLKNNIIEQCYEPNIEQFFNSMKVDEIYQTMWQDLKTVIDRNVMTSITLFLAKCQESTIGIDEAVAEFTTSVMAGFDKRINALMQQIAYDQKTSNNPDNEEIKPEQCSNIQIDTCNTENISPHCPPMQSADVNNIEEKDPELANFDALLFEGKHDKAKQDFPDLWKLTRSKNGGKGSKSSTIVSTAFSNAAVEEFELDITEDLNMLPHVVCNNDHETSNGHEL